jgi:multidrug transporter EmrE-like cation transporter
LGVVCYGAVMVLFVAAFKRGGSLAVLYPVYASTFVWAASISAAAFGTPLKPINIAGMGLLVAGMYCMGRWAGTEVGQKRSILGMSQVRTRGPNGTKPLE